jgi:hypothetical protein
MTGLRLHPRTMPVQRAHSELAGHLCDFQDRHDLTDTEMAMMLADLQHRYLTLLLRAERHPDDPERKADEE